MAIHDYVIANQNGANTRSDLNNALAAIVSNNSSATAPSTTYAYMWWADTAADILKQRNAADSAWINILTLSTGAPLATIANFTSTGIDDNATSTAITIDASEFVGIGTSSPEKTLDVTGNFAGELGLVRINNDNTSTSPVTTSALEFGNNGTIKASIAAQVYGAGDMMFRTDNNTEKLRILGSGGITFNGDTAAANALEDYEEGTFTPYVNNTGGTPSYSIQSGNYTKIGNRVIVQIYLNLTVTPSGSTGLNVGGLPFSLTSSSKHSAASIFPVVGFGGSWDMICPDFSGGTSIDLYKASSTTGTNYANFSASDMGTTMNFRLNITYQTDS